MTTVENNTIWNYKYLFEDLPNPITKEWFLVGNPISPLILCITYLVFSKILGPLYMKNKEPYNIKPLIRIYNIVQIAISMHLVIECTNRLFFTEYDWKCQDMSELGSQYFMWEAKGIYTYYIEKITELVDTVFFVLRKSYRQITFLHLFHHTLMIITSWIACTYYPGGQMIICGYVNSIVHIVMYTYYSIASFGGRYKKILWWKKYVTILQLVQFSFAGIHSVRSLFYSCGFPTAFKLTIILNALNFTYLFGKFYYITYIKKEKETKGKSVNGTPKNGKSIKTNHLS